MKKLFLIFSILLIATIAFSQGTTTVIVPKATTIIVQSYKINTMFQQESPAINYIAVQQTTANTRFSTLVSDGEVTPYLVNIDTVTYIETRYHAAETFAPLASPVITGVATIPTPFTLGAISTTATGTQINYLAAATGTTGTNSTNLVYSTSPTLTTPTFTGGAIQNFTPAAYNATTSITAAHMLGGVITSTSAAPTSLTTPTATAIMALIPDGGIGTTFDLIIDNSDGADVVTLVLDGSISVITPAITGGATLTVSAANSVALFKFYFTSATAAHCFRIY